MKFWRKRILAMVLCLACLLPAASLASKGQATENSDAMEWIRIGLYYGSDALSAANLENHTNSGYTFGYTDSEFNFHPLAYTGTDMTQITMLKTQNMYYGGGSSYSTENNGGTAVGCYHLQVGAGYATYEEAAAVASQYDGGYVAWIQGVYEARTGAYTSKDAAMEAQASRGLTESSTIVGTSSYGINIVATKSARILFQFDGGAEIPLTVRPGLNPDVKPITWFKGYRYYGDFRYERIDGGNLTVVSLINMDDYINCVISQEMSKSWPVEALKAQAVCARTYAEIHQNKHKSYHFDLCGTTECQAYIGMARTDSVTETAARETAGVRLWYDGKLAETYYFSSSGGTTEDVRNVWGGSKAYPYLVGVEDPYELSVADEIEKAYGSRNYHYTITYTKAELAEILRKKGYQCSSIVDFRVSEFSPTGNVVTITFLDSNGKSYSFSGEKYIRTMMGAPSFHYTVSGGGKYYINDKGDHISSVNGVYAIGAGGVVEQIGLSEMPCFITNVGGVEQLAVPGDTFTITGAGWGHNVGMSQWGAYAMAKQGKTYDEILTFYFTGTELY